jgi:hypothetical protein
MYPSSIHMSTCLVATKCIYLLTYLHHRHLHYLPTYILYLLLVSRLGKREIRWFNIGYHVTTVVDPWLTYLWFIHNWMTMVFQWMMLYYWVLGHIIFFGTLEWALYAFSSLSSSYSYLLFSQVAIWKYVWNVLYEIRLLGQEMLRTRF